VGAGCAYDLSDEWKLNVGGRYVDLGKVVWGDSNIALSSKDISSIDALIGLRYQF
jgi:opacity protein-like surface antigen